MSAVAVVAITCFWLSRRKSVTLPTHPSVAQASLIDKLTVFAYLADRCYWPQNHTTAVIYNGWRFDPVVRYMGGFISVWQLTGKPAGNNEALFPVRTGNHLTYVVAVRGSHLVLDWVYLDVLLAFLPEKFQEIATDRFQRLSGELNKLFPPTAAEVETQVIFCGHSLGSSFAEIFYHLSQQPNKHQLWSTVKTVGAVTFDSPGLDEALHVELGVEPDAKGVLVVNSAVNIVNMLYRPRCEKLYGCGRGSNIEFRHVIYLAMKFTVLDPLAALSSIFNENAAEHPMSTIINYLIGGDVALFDRNDWWILSGVFLNIIKSAARLVYRAANKFATHVPPVRDEPDTLPNPAQFPSGYHRHVNLRRVPVNINDLQQSVPYYVGFQDGAYDLTAFVAQRQSTDFFVPVIGLTGVGKSSFVRAMLNIPKDGCIPIGHEGNTTREILVAAYQGGSPHPAPHRTCAPHVDLIGDKNISKLARHFVLLSGCAMLVLDTNIPYESIVEDVKKFVGKTKFHLLIVVNNREKYVEDAHQRLATIKTFWIKTGLVSAADVVMVRANVCRDDFDVEPAKVALNRLLDTRGRDINDVIDEREDAFNEYIKTAAGQEELQAEFKKLKTWGRFAGMTAFYTTTGLVVAGITAASLAAPAAVVAWGWIAYYGAATTVTVGGTAGAAAGIGTGVGAVANTIFATDDSNRTLVNEATENVKTAFRRRLLRAAAQHTNLLQPASRRVFLMDIPGHGGASEL